MRFVTIRQVNGMTFMILALGYFTGTPVFLVRRVKGATLTTGTRHSSPPPLQFLWLILFLNKTRNWTGTHLSLPGIGPNDHLSLSSRINQINTLYAKKKLVFMNLLEVWKFQNFTGEGSFVGLRHFSCKVNIKLNFWYWSSPHYCGDNMTWGVIYLCS